MTKLNLANHVRFCEVGGRRVFLDLRIDRYFSLPPPADTAFAALLQGGVPAPAEIQALRASGMLVEAPAGRPLDSTSHPEPTASFVEDGEMGKGLTARLMAEVLILVLQARSAVRRRRLPKLLSSAADSRGLSESSSADRRDRALADFLRARRALPIAPNCLYDSLALKRFLKRRSVAADLVIGTKLHPFAAHCWLQDGTTVLNDSLAAARGFAPILVA
jgi:hypothetical protein